MCVKRKCHQPMTSLNVATLHATTSMSPPLSISLPPHHLFEEVKRAKAVLVDGPCVLPLGGVGGAGGLAGSQHRHKSLRFKIKLEVHTQW